MDIRDVKLVVNMTKEDVFRAGYGEVVLIDEVYLGVKHKHNWKCKCGTIIKDRTWDSIKRRSVLKCEKCRYDELEKHYKYEVEKDGDYEYVRSFRNGDVLPNGKTVKRKIFIEMMHKYCENTHVIESSDFINRSRTCRKCCDSYENSFAYYIEVELGLKLEDVWDFEKNKVNPYHISKGTDSVEVWIKCLSEKHHESYLTYCSSFKRSYEYTTKGCPYCTGKKIHPKDSFAQYHIDNTDPNFLEKYWDYNKNTLNPWEISIRSGKKVWIKCQNEEVNELNGLMKKDYHGSYETLVSNFAKGHRCHYCSKRMMHPYDSFGYHNLDKAQSWHADNEISPFNIAPLSGKKFKFVCEDCGSFFFRMLCDVTIGSVRCIKCTCYKGESKISNCLDYNNIKYTHDHPYFNDLLSDLGNPLRPDFILPDYKIWIEYDGEFHYKKMYDETKYNKLQLHDKRKNEYAKKHGWKMIRIPYTDFDNIEEILQKEIIDSNKLI